ncbi:cation-translocating P-type ATPase [Ruminococcaceae bacterium OttesenSCG-928-N02]|nr:cation-translocating P-type ATPase [Ruminococcaceae bacterium OttesenSCG-928-N02]
MTENYFEACSTVLDKLGATTDGLPPETAAARLAENGPNVLAQGVQKTMARRILEQIKDPMVVVLIAAGAVSGAFGEMVDMLIIFVVVIINTILGIYQEGKAEKALEALQQLSTPHTTVRRAGAVLAIPSEELVVGDVVLLNAGDSVPADMRLLQAASLKIEEAALTGESVPVEKHTAPLPQSETPIPLGERANMAYMGTSVTYGRGEGVVCATGMNTQMGKIADILTNTVAEKTPLQQKLSALSKTLSTLVLGICVLIFTLGMWRGWPLLESLLTAVSLAVAAIPEGLVVVVTVLLSIGVTKMSKRSAIVRRLTAVETLGCTQVICSDKTGTLTQNKMTVVAHWGDETLLATAMALCNDTQVSPGGELLGDPTETALVAYAQSLQPPIALHAPRVGEAPFDSSRKMMSTLHQEGDVIRQYTKGAPDEVLKCCTHIYLDGARTPLTEAHVQQVLAQNKTYADKALRVLGAAWRDYDTLPADMAPQALEQELTFIGLAGMMDPVRAEVAPAIKICGEAGMRPVMITGDHKDTATAIARELGILTDDSQAITGAQLDAISDDEFLREIEHITVYARVQPEHKVRIVKTWKQKGKITAMTGDGVNDAPSIKTADIGVGMGITGTDVTKNVADVVLADDNFSTIVYAVEEGRRIYSNIRKAIQFLLASNLSEVVAILSATLMGFQLLTPIQILWINLITDTFPAMALGMEGAEADAMKQPPRSASEGILAGGLGVDVIWQGVLIAALTLISYFIPGPQATQATRMSMAFLTLSLAEIFHAVNMRSREKSVFKMQSGNKYLWAAVLAAFALTCLLMYTPALGAIFNLVPLPAMHYLQAAGLAFLVLPTVELVKLARRNTQKRKQNT